MPSYNDVHVSQILSKFIVSCLYLKISFEVVS